MTSLRAVLLAVALPSALVLAGCSNDVGSSGNQGYVAGAPAGSRDPLMQAMKGAFLAP